MKIFSGKTHNAKQSIWDKQNIDIDSLIISIYRKQIPIFSLSNIKLENRLVTVKNDFQLLGRTIPGCTNLGRGEIKFYPSTK